MLAAASYPARVTNASEPGCLFCGIVAGEIPGDIIHQGPHTVALRDIAPVAPTHVLVIPRDHHPDLAALVEADPGLTTELMATAVEIADLEGLTAGGYRVVLNTGHDGGQTVGHVHAHVLGGRPMTWPPG